MLFSRSNLLRKATICFLFALRTQTQMEGLVGVTGTCDFLSFYSAFFTHSEQPRFERITLGLMVNGIREEKRESA